MRTPAWRARTPPRWRWLPVRWRRPTVPMILEPATGFIVGRVLVHQFVLIFRFKGPLEPRCWPLLSITCSRFCSSKRLPWWRRARGQNAGLRRVCVMLILLVSVMRAWRWRPIICYGPNLRRRTVPSPIWRHRSWWPMSARLSVYDAGAANAVVGVVNARGS